jgi:hypothetical protein
MVYNNGVTKETIQESINKLMTSPYVCHGTVGDNKKVFDYLLIQDLLLIAKDNDSSCLYNDMDEARKVQVLYNAAARLSELTQ